MADKAKMTGALFFALGMLCYGAALALGCFVVMAGAAVADGVRGSRTLQAVARFPA